jgi:hypothetical protein
LGVLALLVASLLFSAGCSTSAQPDQALKQQNEKLQKKLDDQKEEQQKEKKAEEKKKEEAQQADLEKQVNDLQEQVDNQKQNNQQSDNQASDSSSASPDAVIENSSVSPTQAPEGVVVVSSDYNTSAATPDEAAAINGAIDYYQYAEVGDYYSTYSLLADGNQNYYTENEWVTANTNMDSQAAEFVVTDASYNDVGSGYPNYLIDVSVYYLDGSVEYRQTNFTNEHGYWAHALSMDEMGMFDSAL